MRIVGAGCECSLAGELGTVLSLQQDLMNVVMAVPTPLAVKGCRTTAGEYRGISTFDKMREFPGFKWYKLPAGTKIPEALAITQDSAKPNESNHYTIAPKDDMPLELFQKWLNVLNLALVAID